MHWIWLWLAGGLVIATGVILVAQAGPGSGRRATLTAGWLDKLVAESLPGQDLTVRWRKVGPPQSDRALPMRAEDVLLQVIAAAPPGANLPEIDSLDLPVWWIELDVELVQGLPASRFLISEGQVVVSCSAQSPRSARVNIERAAQDARTVAERVSRIADAAQAASVRALGAATDTVSQIRLVLTLVEHWPDDPTTTSAITDLHGRGSDAGVELLASAALGRWELVAQQSLNDAAAVFHPEAWHGLTSIADRAAPRTARGALARAQLRSVHSSVAASATAAVGLMEGAEAEQLLLAALSTHGGTDASAPIRRTLRTVGGALTVASLADSQRSADQALAEAVRARLVDAGADAGTGGLAMITDDQAGTLAVVETTGDLDAAVDPDE